VAVCDGINHLGDGSTHSRKGLDSL
jgi:hypothetical protein